MNKFILSTLDLHYLWLTPKIGCVSPIKMNKFILYCPQLALSLQFEKENMEENEYISIRGARVNNLKNINVDIPRGKLVVITGLSGSGKSSLAFDTLYAEGQRRYVESLNSYARQFLGRMSKPQCDFIKGIPPAIAIQQRVISRNPRSTVGTSTEIYEYLCLLFARIGRTYSPISGDEVKKHSVEDVVQCMLSHEDGIRFTVLVPILLPEGRTLEEELKADMLQGFHRVEVNEEIMLIEDYKPKKRDKVNLLIDRMVVSREKDAVSRLTDSIETAMYKGAGRCMLRFYLAGGKTKLFSFSNKFEADGMTFEEPSEQMFSFNSPLGACPKCEGFGKIIGIDERLVVPNRALSIYDGAILCWRGEVMSSWKDDLCRNAAKFNFPIFEPYYKLTDEQRKLLWTGNEYFEGLNEFFEMLRKNQYKIQYRVMLSRYRGKTTCPVCHGSRLKPEAAYVRVGGKSMMELVDMPIVELKAFFDGLTLDEHDMQVANRVLVEIKTRLQFLTDVGLDYLTLNRLSNTLSGGESQRINLVTSLGSSLVGSLYILDEPSIGLHSRDTQRLIYVLRELQQLGNTVVVVEHDEEIIRAADYIIDIGPQAGRLGGEVVYQGDLKDIKKGSKSYTLRYLTGEEQIPVPSTRRSWNNHIDVIGARENNLKGIDVSFPLNVMTVVTGVSGSGKSTLVRDIFFKALKRELDEYSERPGEFAELRGDIHALKNIEFVDQNPIGKSSRSNPVTYVKAYDEIRKLWADQTLSKQMGYTPGYFSFNSEGGRCEECKGEGTITVEMQFMADLVLECESCHGKRFKADTLEVKFHEKSIYDVLEMTVNQAIEFFTEFGETKIVNKLRPLQNVGLGYIKLGQSSSTLSGGENQRVKLAYFLGQEKVEPTMFIFDEPTTGLHFHDINQLLKSFNELIQRGHSVLIIEHNMEIIKNADYVIDLGPDGGEQGGTIVACGTPEEVAKCGKGYTAKFLKGKLKLR
jgi:excinuclease ABC subunit A